MAHIAAHRDDAPSLDEIAAAAHLSPLHFQRMFTSWAGVIRKRFASSLFGEILLAVTPREICHIAFTDERKAVLNRLRAAHPAARLSATGASHRRRPCRRHWTGTGRQRRRSGFIFTARNSR